MRAFAQWHPRVATRRSLLPDSVANEKLYFRNGIIPILINIVPLRNSTVIVGWRYLFGRSDLQINGMNPGGCHARIRPMASPGSRPGGRSYQNIATNGILFFRNGIYYNHIQILLNEKLQGCVKFLSLDVSDGCVKFLFNIKFYFAFCVV